MNQVRSDFPALSISQLNAPCLRCKHYHKMWPCRAYWQWEEKQTEEGVVSQKTRQLRDISSWNFSTKVVLSVYSFPNVLNISCRLGTPHPKRLVLSWCVSRSSRSVFDDVTRFTEHCPHCTKVKHHHSREMPEKVTGTSWLSRLFWVVCREHELLSPWNEIT